METYDEIDPNQNRDEAAEEQAAAADAAAIGGDPGDVGMDPAMRAVYEGGGGEAEGFEMAEEDLVEHASHGDAAPSPLDLAFSPERESDRSTAAYGEPDEFEVSEQVADPDVNEDEDPGAGPGIARTR